MSYRSLYCGMFFPVSVLLPHLDRKATCNLKLISYAWHLYENFGITTSISRCTVLETVASPNMRVFFWILFCLVALASELMSCTIFVVGEIFCLIACTAIYEFTRSQNAQWNQGLFVFNIPLTCHAVFIIF